MIFNPKSTQLRSRRTHYAVLTGLWIYTLAWAALGIAIILNRQSDVPLVVGVLAIGLFVIGTPPFKNLFLSYTKYEARWRRANMRRDSQAKERDEA